MSAIPKILVVRTLFVPTVLADTLAHVLQVSGVLDHRAKVTYVCLTFILYQTYQFTLDINECTYGHHNCAAKQYCHNSIGSFQCSCPVGWEGDGISPSVGGSGCTGITLAYIVKFFTDWFLVWCRYKRVRPIQSMRSRCRVQKHPRFI